MIDSKIIKNNFSNSVENYNNFALIQKQCAEKLCNLSRDFIKNDDLILDLGSGTSFIAKNLTDDYNCKIFEADISLQMLKQWNSRPSSCFALSANIENLPFPEKPIFNMVISSFALQWIENFDKLFAYLQKIIKNSGVIIFCLPTKNSLQQIRKASEISGCNFNFTNLPDQGFIRQKLLENNFTEILFSQEIVEQKNENATEFLRNIKKIGANYSSKNNFVTKKRLEKFNDFFSEKFNNTDCWYTQYFIYTKSTSKSRLSI